MGSANEIVADCRFDLAAWVQKAEKLGFRNIVLLGHSLGAIKTLYAMTHEPPRSTCLKGIVAVSPSCLAASTFLASSRAEEYQRYLGWARQQIEQGAENRITEVTFPLRLMMSARTFLDKYGPEERYNILRFLDQVPLPLKLVFGELEVRGENPAFRDLDRKAAEVVGTDSGSSLTVVTGADHFYSGVQDRLADCILDWTRNLV